MFAEGIDQLIVADPISDLFCAFREQIRSLLQILAKMSDQRSVDAVNVGAFLKAMDPCYANI